MQQTSLYGEYASSGAKVVDFHGWALPLQFSGIIQEHRHTRSKAGLFDCSHMGEFVIEGNAAIAALDALVYANYTDLPVGRCRYGALLNEQAGIVDDCVALRLDEETLYLVTNAGTVEPVAALLSEKVPNVTDVTDITAKIDIQGPLSRVILLNLGMDAVRTLKFWTCTRTTWKDTPIVVSRAGYTGELGYELYIPNDIAVDVWRTLLAQPEVVPCGLGARDTLRLEMGYPLYGEDVTVEQTPLEGAMDRFIAWDTEFPGKDRLLAQRASGDYARLVALESPDRRAPRAGFELKYDGAVVGRVTSGTFGPSVGYGIGLGHITAAAAAAGTPLTAGPRELPVTVTALPFYKEGTCRIRVE